MGAFKCIRWFVLIVVFPLVLMALIIVVVSMISRERIVHINSGETYVMSLSDSILSGDLTIMSTSQNVSLFYYHKEPLLTLSEPATLTGRYWLNPGENVMYSHYLEQGSIITLNFASIQGVNFFLFKGSEPFTQFENRSQADYLIMKLSMNNAQESLTYHINSKDTYFMVFDNVYDDFYSHLDLKLSIQLMEFRNGNNNSVKEEEILSVDCMDCLTNKISKGIKKVFILPLSYSSNGYIAIENTHEQKLINVTSNKKSNLIWSPSLHAFKHLSPLTTITIQGDVENDKEFWRFLFLTILCFYLLLLYLHNIYFTSYRVNFPVGSTGNVHTNPPSTGMDKCLEMTFLLEESARKRLLRRTSESLMENNGENGHDNGENSNVNDIYSNGKNDLKRFTVQHSPTIENCENNDKIKINLHGKHTYGSISDVEFSSSSNDLDTSNNSKKNNNDNIEVKKPASPFFNYFLKYRKLEPEYQKINSSEDTENGKKVSDNMKNDNKNKNKNKNKNDTQNLWDTFSTNCGGTLARQENPMLGRPNNYRRMSGTKEDLSRRGRIVSVNEKNKREEAVKDMALRNEENEKINGDRMIDGETSVLLVRSDSMNERDEMRKRKVDQISDVLVSQSKNEEEKEEEEEKKGDFLKYFDEKNLLKKYGGSKEITITDNKNKINANDNNSNNEVTNIDNNNNNDNMFNNMNNIEINTSDDRKEDERLYRSSSMNSIGSDGYRSCCSPIERTFNGNESTYSDEKNGIDNDNKSNYELNGLKNVMKNDNNGNDDSANKNDDKLIVNNCSLNSINNEKKIEMEDDKNINDSTIINKNINNIPVKSVSIKDEILLLRSTESNVTKKVDKLEKNIKVNSLGNENGNEPKYENKNRKIYGNEGITQNALQNKSDNSKIEISKEMTKNENLQIKIPDQEFRDYIPKAINKLRVLTPIVNNRKSIDEKKDESTIGNSVVTTV